MHYRFSWGLSSAANCNWFGNDVYFQPRGFQRKKKECRTEYPWDLDCLLAYVCPYEETDQLSLNLVVVLLARFFSDVSVNTPILLCLTRNKYGTKFNFLCFFFSFFECFMFIRTHRALTWNKPKVSSKFSFTRRSLKFNLSSVVDRNV